MSRSTDPDIGVPVKDGQSIFVKHGRLAGVCPARYTAVDGLESAGTEAEAWRKRTYRAASKNRAGPPTITFTLVSQEPCMSGIHQSQTHLASDVSTRLEMPPNCKVFARPTIMSKSSRPVIEDSQEIVTLFQDSVRAVPAGSGSRRLYEQVKAMVGRAGDAAYAHDPILGVGGAPLQSSSVAGLGLTVEDLTSTERGHNVSIHRLDEHHTSVEVSDASEHDAVLTRLQNMTSNSALRFATDTLLFGNSQIPADLAASLHRSMHSSWLIDKPALWLSRRSCNSDSSGMLQVEKWTYPNASEAVPLVLKPEISLMPVEEIASAIAGMVRDSHDNEDQSGALLMLRVKPIASSQGQ